MQVIDKFIPRIDKFNPKMETGTYDGLAGINHEIRRLVWKRDNSYRRWRVRATYWSQEIPF